MVERLSDEGVAVMSWVLGIALLALYLWLVFRIGGANKRKTQEILDRIRCAKRVYHRTEDGSAFKEE